MSCGERLPSRAATPSASRQRRARVDDRRFDYHGAVETLPEPQSPPESPQQPRARGFAEIHRDVWRVALAHPGIFIVLPALFWWPMDLITELILQAQPRTEMEELRLSFRLSSFWSLLPGTLVTSITYAAMLELGNQGRTSLATSLTAGVKLWGAVVGVYLLAGFMVGIGFLFFIIPGLVLAVRYALAQPAAAFERSGPRASLDRSARIVSGRWKLVLFGTIAAFLIYAPLAMVPLVLSPFEIEAWTTATLSIPMNVFINFITIAMGLIYVDARDGEAMAAPVGAIPTAHPEETGGRGVAAMSVASVAALLVSIVGFWMLALRPIDQGDEAWERGDVDAALAHYERAAAFDATDAYVQFSIGWCHRTLEDYPAALVAFAEAVRLDPGVPEYALDHARSLLNNGRWAEAIRAIDAAEKIEGVDASVIAELRGQAQGI